ncbi:MAG: hypothetical protein J2P17_24210 [Mycobacterium sp.]|nr:hypothetical protein [Mycobacterium sp.]
MVATCDYVAAKLRNPRRIQLSFDEGNVWYQSRFAGPEQLEWPTLLPADTRADPDSTVVTQTALYDADSQQNSHQVPVARYDRTAIGRRHTDRVAAADLVEPDPPQFRMSAFQRSSLVKIRR